FLESRAGISYRTFSLSTTPRVRVSTFQSVSAKSSLAGFLSKPRSFQRQFVSPLLDRTLRLARHTKTKPFQSVFSFWQSHGRNLRHFHKEQQGNRRKCQSSILVREGREVHLSVSKILPLYMLLPIHPYLHL